MPKAKEPRNNPQRALASNKVDTALLCQVSCQSEFRRELIVALPEAKNSLHPPKVLFQPIQSRTQRFQYLRPSGRRKGARDSNSKRKPQFQPEPTMGTFFHFRFTASVRQDRYRNKALKPSIICFTTTMFVLTVYSIHLLWEIGNLDSGRQ